MIEDYVVDIIDSENILIKGSLLLNEYPDSLFEVGKDDLVMLIRELDADYDDEMLIDVSSYYLKVGSTVLNYDNDIAKEIFKEVEDMAEYIRRYRSY